MNSYLIINTSILIEHRFKRIKSTPLQLQAQFHIISSLNIFKVWQLYIINTHLSVKKITVQSKYVVLLNDTKKIAFVV